ncbi:MAG: glycosyltransferase family 2 protein [Candidatus Wildermuthbacteria bacterium]|nr:glycosyltransferase family 2 protein [Candidatus Wildermuthbacteria bacterium]
MNIVIPMAGAGKRFQDAGYTVPKPFIGMKGKTMLEWSLESLYMEGARFILIVRTPQLLGYEYVMDRIQKKYPCVVIPIDTLTQGMASSVLLAEEYISTKDPLLIGACDQTVDVPMQEFIGEARNRELAGSLMTFYSTHPKWSYAKVDEKGLVVETKEKSPISTHANVGLYYFERGRDFVNAAKRMIAQNDRFNNEFYVAPVYNYMIQNGAKVGIYEIKESHMHGLGTPEDVQEFLKS